MYRQQAGGGWTRVGGAITYGKSEDLSRSFVTADGTHLVGLPFSPPHAWSEARSPDTRRYRALRGGTYEPVELDGLPATAVWVQRAPGGGVFFAVDHTSSAALHQSADGWH